VTLSCRRFETGTFCRRMSPDAQRDQQLRPSDKGWQLTSLTLRLTSGVLLSQSLQPLVAEFVGACDGSRTLAELTEALAAKVNASLDQVRRECLVVMRQLIERGFLSYGIYTDSVPTIALMNPKSMPGASNGETLPAAIHTIPGALEVC